MAQFLLRNISILKIPIIPDGLQRPSRDPGRPDSPSLPEPVPRPRPGPAALASPVVEERRVQPDHPPLALRPGAGDGLRRELVALGRGQDPLGDIPAPIVDLQEEAAVVAGLR